MDRLQSDIGNWHKETFPDATDLDVWSKFIEEANEFIADEKPDEAADVIICLMAWASRKKISLESAVLQKMDVNRKRDWSTRKNGGG